MNDEGFDKDALLYALKSLERRLNQHGVRAHIYIVGGALMILAHGRSRVTSDVDALEIIPRTAVLELAIEVASELGLQENWLNDEVTFIDQRVVRIDDLRKTVYNSPNLVVTGASAEQMLSLKVFAGRETDRPDIKILLKELNIQNYNEIEEIFDHTFPYDEIPLNSAKEAKQALLELKMEAEQD